MTLEPPTEILPQAAMNVALGELRGVMIQYTNCANPSESATRKERLRLAKEQGQFEETAAQMVRATLTNRIYKEDENPQPSSQERIPASQRLGPLNYQSPENQLNNKVRLNQLQKED